MGIGALVGGGYSRAPLHNRGLCRRAVSPEWCQPNPIGLIARSFPPANAAIENCHFIRLSGETSTARELYDRMLALYPDRINPGSLWGSANAAKPTLQAIA